MPIIEIKVIEHKPNINGKRNRLYKKNIAVCECDSCQVIFEVRRFSKKQRFTFCSKECREKENKNGGKIDIFRKETYLQKYGNDNPLRIDEFKNKRKNTIKERYGVEHIQHSSVWKEKRRETMIQKYGDEFVRTDEFKEKRKHTLVEKYGITTPMQYKEFLEKRKTTFEERYGGYPLSNPKVYLKMFETNLKKYGYRTSFDLAETQTKCYYSIRGYSRDEYLKNLYVYENYRREVRRITEKQEISILENFEKRAKDGYHLDHIFSIANGFKDNISPEIIGDISNLRFIHCRENQTKSDKSDISIEELLRRVHERKR